MATIKWLMYSCKIAKAQELSHYTNVLNELKIIMKQKFQLKSELLTGEKESFIFDWGEKNIQPNISVLSNFGVAPIQRLNTVSTHKSFISMFHKREKNLILMTTFF